MQTSIDALLVQLQIDLQSLIFRVSIVQFTVNGCCDFIAQCTLVRINYCTYHLFIHLNLQRSTVVGSYGVKISGW